MQPFFIFRTLCNSCVIVSACFAITLCKLIHCCLNMRTVLMTITLHHA